MVDYKYVWDKKKLTMAVVLFFFMIWLYSGDYPHPLSFSGEFGDSLLSFGLSDCKYVKTPYDCMSVMECDTVCSSYELFGICMGKEKKDCKPVEKCKYKTKWECDDSNPYDLTPTPDSGSKYESGTKWCPSGTILSGNTCVDPYSDYKKDTKKNWWEGESDKPKHKEYDKTKKKTRLLCGGDVIQNSYMRGWRYVQEQEITTTCHYDCWDDDCDVDCSDKITDLRVKEDCTQLCSGVGIFEKCSPRAKVCQDESGTPVCVTYPLELRIQTIFDAVEYILNKPKN